MGGARYGHRQKQRSTQKELEHDNEHHCDIASMGMLSVQQGELPSQRAGAEQDK